jgi:predicted porin
MRHLFLVFGLGCAAASAQAADVNVFGKIYGEFAREDQGAASFTSLDDAQSAGRLGIRFAQPLGDGLSAFGKYEWAMNATDTGGNFQVRDAFVGLRGPFGSLAVGRFAGAYKATAGTEWDGFAFTSLTPIGQGGMAGGAFGNQGFVSRLLEYRTPRFGTPEGLHLDAVVQVGADDSPANTTTARDSVLGGALLGFRTWELAVAAAGDEATGAENFKVGIRYRGDSLVAGLTREEVESGGFDAVGAGTFLLGHAHWQVGKAQWLVQVGRYDSDDRTTPSDARYLAAGLRWLFAANVWGLVGYRDTASDLAGRDSAALVLGLRFDFDRAL